MLKQSRRRQNAENGLGYQAVVRNACAHEKGQKSNARKEYNWFNCVHCVLRVHSLNISVFWLRRKPCDRCIACVANDNLETACTPMKTDLQVGFWSAVHNAMDTTHSGHAKQIKKLQRMQCMHTKNATDAKIESVASCVSFWLQAVHPLHCVCCAQQLGNRM